MMHSPDKDRSFSECSSSAPSHGGPSDQRSVQTLLWHKISELLQVPERDAVKAELGRDLIEENELLFNEAVALEEILATVKQDTNQHIVSQHLFDSPLRLMLENEVRILVQALQKIGTPLPQDLVSFPPPSKSNQRQALSHVNSNNICISLASEAYWLDDIEGRSVGGEVAVSESPVVDRLSGAVGQDRERCNFDSTLLRNSFPDDQNSLHVGTLASQKPLAQLHVSTIPGSKGLPDSILNDHKYKQTLDHIICRGKVQDWKEEKCSRSLSSRASTTSSSISSDKGSMTDFLSSPGSVSSSQSLSMAPFDPALVVHSVAPHLSLFHIDAVADRLHSALATEHAALLEDVEHLRACLEESTDVYSGVKSEPPSFADMKNCGRKLEEHLWSQQFHKAPTTGPQQLAKTRRHSSVRPLQPGLISSFESSDGQTPPLPHIKNRRQAIVGGSVRSDHAPLPSTGGVRRSEQLPPVSNGRVLSSNHEILGTLISKNSKAPSQRPNIVNQR